MAGILPRIVRGEGKGAALDELAIVYKVSQHGQQLVLTPLQNAELCSQFVFIHEAFHRGFQAGVIMTSRGHFLNQHS
nr:Hypothetical protein [Aeromonas caviae]